MDVPAGMRAPVKFDIVGQSGSVRKAVEYIQGEFVVRKVGSIDRVQFPRSQPFIPHCRDHSVWTGTELQVVYLYPVGMSSE